MKTPISEQAVGVAFSGGGGSGGGGINPTGEIEIYDNGIYNVRNKASAYVNVDQGVFPSGVISINENGLANVYNYSFANVQVPQPAGTIQITENGLQSVKDYVYANVAIPEFDRDSVKARLTITHGAPGSFRIYINYLEWDNTGVYRKTITLDGGRTSATIDVLNRDAVIISVDNTKFAHSAKSDNVSFETVAEIALPNGGKTYRTYITCSQQTDGNITIVEAPSLS